MDKEPPSTPQQDIKIDKEASLDNAQVGMAGGNLTQIQMLFNLFGFGKKESSIQRDSLQLRDKLIRDLKERTDNAILKSLHKELPIQLDKETYPSCVQPISVENIKVDNRQSEDLPKNTSLVDVFFKFKGKLLILGAPGAGKTTEMLKIAEKLVDDAGSDCNKPIPIWLDLSSWKNENQTFTQWVVAKISSKYCDNSKNSKNLLKKFLNEHQVILLLDNFDKLFNLNHYERCTKEINDVLESNKYYSSMVVCSCNDVYKLYNTKLKLNKAVFIKPLNSSKIEPHLTHLELSDLWQQIKSSNELLELAKTPFLLNIIILAYGDEKISLEERQSLDEKKFSSRYSTILLIGGLRKNR